MARFLIVALAALCFLCNTPSIVAPPPTVPAVYNDAEYTGVGLTTCTDPVVVKCNNHCNDTAGDSGHYILPLSGACVSIATSTNAAYCKYASSTRGDCCKACADKATCSYWQHYLPSGICYLYPAGAPAPACSTTQVTVANKTRLNTNVSTVGLPCAVVLNDPHFRGGDGTRFEFNGLPDQTFCLLTDRNLHVNMRMRGYFDTRTVGATILSNGKAVRTWIREVGILWTDVKSGRTHSLRMAARDGKSSERGEGYVGEIEIDGQMLPLLKLGEHYNLPGGGSLAFASHEKAGGGFFDVDAYRLTVEDLLDMEIKARVAHPLLQTPDDAQSHLNVHFIDTHRTSAIHGVMGQTYRAGREKRRMEYSALSALLGRPFAADGEGKGFLDGDVKDYRATDVLAADCVYTAFGGRQLPEIEPYKGLVL